MNVWKPVVGPLKHWVTPKLSKHVKHQFGDNVSYEVEQRVSRSGVQRLWGELWHAVREAFE